MSYPPRPRKKMQPPVRLPSALAHLLDVQSRVSMIQPRVPEEMLIRTVPTDRGARVRKAVSDSPDMWVDRWDEKRLTWSTFERQVRGVGKLVLSVLPDIVTNFKNPMAVGLDPRWYVIKAVVVAAPSRLEKAVGYPKRTIELIRGHGGVYKGLPAARRALRRLGFRFAHRANCLRATEVLDRIEIEAKKDRRVYDALTCAMLRAHPITNIPSRTRFSWCLEIGDWYDVRRLHRWLSCMPAMPEGVQFEAWVQSRTLWTDLADPPPGIVSVGAHSKAELERAKRWLLIWLVARQLGDDSVDGAGYEG